MFFFIFFLYINNKKKITYNEDINTINTKKYIPKFLAVITFKREENKGRVLENIMGSLVSGFYALNIITDKTFGIIFK